MGESSTCLVRSFSAGISAGPKECWFFSRNEEPTPCSDTTPWSSFSKNIENRAKSRGPDESSHQDVLRRTVVSIHIPDQNFGQDVPFSDVADIFKKNRPHGCVRNMVFKGDSLRPPLATSISFGRFTSESLDWDKWSCFSNNRYVEEAEKSSKPGSVAAKKAYFESHYKGIAAAKKAAALLEQQVIDTNELDLPESDNVDYYSPYRSLVVSEPSQSDTPKTDIVLSVDENARDPNVEELATQKNSIQVELSHWNEKNLEIHSKVVSSQQEMMATTPSSCQGRSSSTSKNELSIHSSNSFKSIRPSKLPSSVKLSPVQESKEDSTTSRTCRKPVSNLVEKKISTLKSLHMSISFASHTSGTRKTQAIIHKMEHSEMVRSSAKASKDSSTLQMPTRAPVNRLSVHYSQTNLPSPERRRSKPLDYSSSSGRRAPVGKSQSQSPSTDRFKSAGASGNEGRPPIISSSFSFRCEERAAKRKEKLEEKLNAREEIMRMQAKSKIPLPRPRSPILGRKPTPSIVRDTGSLPPWRSSVTMGGSKHSTLKSNRTHLYSINTVLRKNIQENASPNIQL